MNRWILVVAIVVAFLLAGAGVLLLPGLDKFFNRTAGKSEEPMNEVANLQTSRMQKQKPPSPLEKSPPPGPGWAVNCKSPSNQKEFECRLSQTVVTKQGRRVLANVTVLIPPDAKTPDIRIQVPLLVYLPAGASYQIDQGTPRALEFRACVRDGCYGQTPVAPEVLAALKKGIATYSDLPKHGAEANQCFAIPGWFWGCV